MSNMQLSNDKHDVEDLEKKYNDFIAPAFKLLIDNTDAVREGMAISSVVVETTTAEQADAATFTVTNAYDLISRDFNWVDKLLSLGNTLEVSMGYTDRLTPIFFGYITAVQFEFHQDEAPRITVTAMDLSFKMMRGREMKLWKKTKASDVIRALGSHYGANQFVIDDTGRVLPNLLKKPDNDYQFIQTLAQSLNYEFFIVGKTLYFRKKNSNKTPVMILSWGKHLSHFQLEQNLSEQVTKVTVRSWDEAEQKAITGTSSRVNKIGTNSKTGPDIMKTLGEFEEMIYLNAEDIQDAKEKAEAALNERALRLVSGEAECWGVPELRAGRYVKLEGLGKRLNQPYYIKSATHIINESGYVTKLRVQGNAV